MRHTIGPGLSSVALIANMSKRSAHMLDVKRPTLFLHETCSFQRLTHEDVFHQVGFGPWSSLCDSRSVWFCKLLARRVQWFEIGMSESSVESEYVVQFTSRVKLEPQES